MERLRVAAYCRVSTDKADQIHSLAAQQRYFADYIARHPGWELVGIWADEGVSGTSTTGRKQFRALMAVAAQGLIDLIVTKEVSRFARNTVDTLACTRRLRDWGVGVAFLSDHIDTRAEEGEFRLTIMASVAQEESRKISERVKWGQRRSMEQGVVFGPRVMYGYRVEQGVLRLCAEQAAVVRRVYQMFLEEGKGTHTIARALTDAGVPTPRGAAAWSSTMVLRLLRNEKYCGDLLQKKTCTPDFLTHRKVRNRGQEQTIYLPAHHEGAVSRAQFARVQQELARRQSAQPRHSVRYWCSGRIRCGRCGRTLLPRRSRHRDGSVIVRWRCRTCGGRSTLDTALRACAEAALCRTELDTEPLLHRLCVQWRQAEQQAGQETGRTLAQRRDCLRGLLRSDAVLAACIARIEVQGETILVWPVGAKAAFPTVLMGDLAAPRRPMEHDST
ncbi:MAG: recombinase family protein [Eubacteriales bacterium]|nr:recombinase family protein [Eubacteriales bacterium]